MRRIVLGLLLAAPLAAQIPVAVSIPPQKYFVERIAAGQARVTVLIPPGSDPHHYEPKPRQMAEFSRSRIYFTIGFPLEKAWAAKFLSANPGLQVVATDQGVEKIAGEDPHIWVAPRLVKQISRNIAAALSQAEPAKKDFFQANLRVFLTQLDSLDADLRKMFSGFPAPPAFLVFHPSWGYFVRDYGLRQLAVEQEGKEPSPRELKQIIKQAKDLGIKVVFVSPEFSQKSAKMIAEEINGRTALANPLAENWLENMRLMAEGFKEAIR